MNNSFQTQRATFVWTDPSGSYETFPELRIRSFAYSGFGHNDPKKRKIPTEGSYHLEERQYMQGSFRQRITDTFLGETYSASASGVMSGVYADHLGSLDVDWWMANYNNALTKLYERIRESNANLATSVGEGKETYAMIKKAILAVKDLTSLARTARKHFGEEIARYNRFGRRTNRKGWYEERRTLQFSEYWLSYKLGWYPLYKDVYSLLEYTTRRFAEQTFVGRATMQPSRSIRFSQGEQSYVLNTKHKHQTLISLTCSVSDPTAFDTSRITSLNPATVAWELVPFSFFVDYFVDIGGFLELQEAALGRGLSFKDGFWTDVLRLEADETVSLGYSTWDGRFSASYSGYARATRTKTSKYRWRLTGFPRPMPPTLKVSLGAQRLLTAVALFRTVLLGKY